MAKLSKALFVAKAKEVHGTKYDYSLIKLQHHTVKLNIICPTHGLFKQRRYSHLYGRGCPVCAYQTTSKKLVASSKEFVTKARKVHGKFYDYSKVKYKGSFVKVSITCPEHGDFEQTPHGHLTGKGCNECGLLKTAHARITTNKEFVRKAQSVHGHKYDYSKVKYTRATEPVIITCKEHGDFEQLASNHYKGAGCRKCSSAGSKVQRKVVSFLRRLNLRVETDVRTKIVNPASGHYLELDVYLPDYKIAIEVNGVYWHSEERKGQNYHALKQQLCSTSGIRLLQFWDTDILNGWRIVKTKIINALGLRDKIKASVCDIAPCNKRTANSFLLANALTCKPFTHCFSASHDGKIIAVLATDIRRNQTVEIVDFVTAVNYDASLTLRKLFSALIKSTQTKKVITYIDLMSELATSYKLLGFKLRKVTKPRQHVILGHTVYDCGNEKLIWRV